MKPVAQNGAALEHVSTDLKSEREVLEAALKSGGVPKPAMLDAVGSSTAAIWLALRSHQRHGIFLISAQQYWKQFGAEWHCITQSSNENSELSCKDDTGLETCGSCRRSLHECSEHLVSGILLRTFFVRCLDVKADDKTMDTVAEQVLDEIDYIERLGAHVLVYVAVGAIRLCFTKVEQE